jgi:hypothetical protein
MMSRTPQIFLMALIATLAALPQVCAQNVSLTAAQLNRVGQRIWQNECAGSVAGLTSWNSGEDFASLGIGHFIWYPAGQRGPFEESFPALVTFLESQGVGMPAWCKGPCPWKSKSAFEAEAGGARQKELRVTLSKTVSLQTAFILNRLKAALPKMLAATKASKKVKANFDGLSTTPEGAFCLIDYVNFKGEGTAKTERYNGQGWGLLQVLENMTAASPAAFAAASKAVLSRRVQNAPAARKEQRWLAGWHNRCEGYLRKL